MSWAPFTDIEKLSQKMFFIRTTIAISALLYAILGINLFAQAPTPESANKLAEFQFLSGKWSCRGKFVRSGKEISADLSFEPALGGAWILFRHDDRAPFTYHAFSQWGWDSTTMRYVSSIQDSTGNLRLFYSQGWQGTKLTWDGGKVGSEAKERFEFERVSAPEFKVGYSVLKDGTWNSIDSSTCKKVGAL